MVVRFSQLKLRSEGALRTGVYLVVQWFHEEFLIL